MHRMEDTLVFSATPASIRIVAGIDAALTRSSQIHRREPGQVAS
jgi:hypothetical protein